MGHVDLYYTSEMEKIDNIAARWEAALPQSESPSLEDLADSFRKADPQEFNLVDPDEVEENAIYYMTSAIEKNEVGCIDLESINSMHGDGCSVTVYVLPMGTTVLVRSATYELEGSPVAIYRGRDVDEMLSLAYDLLLDDRDYGDIQELDEDEDLDPDTDTTIEEESNLIEQWSKAIQKSNANINEE